MRLHCISQLIDTFNGRIARCVKTDGIVCAPDIVVNCGRNSDNRYSESRQFQRPAESSVSSDSYNTIQPQHFAGGNSPVSSFFCYELFAACCIEYRSSTGKGMSYAFAAEPYKIPKEDAVRTTARTAAFIPGASPPLVSTPILLNSLIFSLSPFLLFLVSILSQRKIECNQKTLDSAHGSMV